MKERPNEHAGDAPYLSIIVCTRNRADKVGNCLRSAIEAAEAAADITTEIILVDNGSTDATGDIVAAFSARSQAVRYHLEPQTGLARARNRGIDEARGQVFAFVDDDCTFDRSFVSDLHRHWGKAEQRMLLGGRIDLGDINDLPLTIKLDNEEQYYRTSIHPAGFIHGCNFTMSRSVFQEIGYFDPAFGVGSKLLAGEDTDYVIRAHDAGVTIRYVPDMAVAHFHGRRTRDAIRKVSAAYATGNGALYAKYAFRCPWILRNFARDVRIALQEIIGVRAVQDPIGLSAVREVWWNCVGAGRYMWRGIASRLWWAVPSPRGDLDAAPDRGARKSTSPLR